MENQSSLSLSSSEKIKQTLLKPGALYDSVISNPTLRSFYWVQSELQNQGKLTTGNDMIGATKLNKNSWSKAGQLDLTCPFKTLPVDLMPSDVAPNRLAVMTAAQNNNDNNNDQQNSTTNQQQPAPQPQPRRVFETKVVDLKSMSLK